MRGLGFPHTRGRVVLLVLVVPLVFRAPCVLHCGPGCFVCPWAAARQISGVAMPRQISGRRVACPPARRPRCELRSARRLEARPGPATAHRHRSLAPGPSGALHTGGIWLLMASRRVCSKPGQAPPPPTGTAASSLQSLRRPPHLWGPVLMCGWRVALMSSYGCQSATSHVIPRRLIQTLNLHRWNCNVLGCLEK